MINNQVSNKKQKGSQILFFILILYCTIVVSITLKAVYYHYATQHWPSVAGSVVFSKHVRKARNTFSEVVVKYKIKNREFESKYEPNCSLDDCNENKWPQNSIIPVWYDPYDQKNITLDLGSSYRWFNLFAYSAISIISGIAVWFKINRFIERN